MTDKERDRHRAIGRGFDCLERSVVSMMKRGDRDARRMEDAVTMLVDALDRPDARLERVERDVVSLLESAAPSEPAEVSPPPVPTTRRNLTRAVLRGLGLLADHYAAGGGGRSVVTTSSDARAVEAALAWIAWQVSTRANVEELAGHGSAD